MASATNVEPACLITPFAFVLGGILLGFVFEKTVMNKLRDCLSDTRLKWGGGVMESTCRVVTLWFGIAGDCLALVELSLGSAVRLQRLDWGKNHRNVERVRNILERAAG